MRIMTGAGHILKEPVRFRCSGVRLMLCIRAATAFAALIFFASLPGVSPAKAVSIQIQNANAGAAPNFILAAAKKKPVGRAAQCKALDRCRGRYTWCDDKVFKTMKPSPKRDAAHEACVDKYRTCIKENFNSGDLLFVRWFWPGECPR